MVIFALASPDDLAVSFRRQTIVAQHRSWIVRIELHVEGFRFLRIVVHEHRPVVPGGNSSFVFGPQILAPLDALSVLLELCHCIGIRNARERRPNHLEGSGIALEQLQLGFSPVETAPHDVGHEVFLQPHVGVRIVPCHFRLDHPEFGQVPTCFGLLRTERRTEAIHFAKRSRRRFEV